MKKIELLVLKARKREKVKKLLLLSLITFIAFTSFITSVFMMKKADNSIKEQLTEDCKNIARTSSITIQNMINQSFIMLDIYSQTEEIKNDSTEKAVTYLETHKNLRPINFLNSFYVNMEGEAFFDTGYKEFMGNEEFFSKIKNLSSIYNLDTKSGITNHGPKFFRIEKAVFNEKNELKGIVGASIELSSLQRLLSEAQISNKISPFIIDEDGVFLSHPNSALLHKTYSPSGEKNSIHTSRNVATGRLTDFDTISEKGEKIHVFTERIKMTPWILGVSVPEEIMNKTKDALWGEKIRMLLSTLIALAACYYFLERVLRLKKLRQSDSTENDPLTDLLCQKAFEKKIVKLVSLHPESEFIAAEIDFDGFRLMNELYGRVQANKALIAFADFEKEVCRVYGGVAGRGYADHFYYFARINSREVTETALKLMRAKILDFLEDSEFPLFPKAGVSFYSPAEDQKAYEIIQLEKQEEENGKKKNSSSSEKDFENVKKSPYIEGIRRAFKEASEARKYVKGKNKPDFAYFNDEIKNSLERNEKIKNDLENAFKNDEFVPYFQHEINAKTNQIESLAASLFWKHPELGIISNENFIEEIEEKELSEKLDYLTLRSSLKTAGMNGAPNELANSSTRISVCFTSKTLHSADFMTNFTATLQKAGVPPTRIKLEIDSAYNFIPNDKLESNLKMLQEDGLLISLTNFSITGRAVEYFLKMPCNEIKFQKDVLKNCLENERTRLVTESIIKTAEKAGINTCLTGAESERDFEEAKKMGATFIQKAIYTNK